MSDIPMPQPMTDDEFAADMDYLFDNYESDMIHIEWQSALEWAHKGDFKPLAECLRKADMPLNNESVRMWLADGLENGFKKPNKVVKKPKLVPFELDGVRYYVDERDVAKLKAIKRYRDLRAQGTRARDALEMTAKEHRIDIETLRNDIQRPYSHWNITNPNTVKQMFAGVVPNR